MGEESDAEVTEQTPHWRKIYLGMARFAAKSCTAIEAIREGNQARQDSSYPEFPERYAFVEEVSPETQQELDEIFPDGGIHDITEDRAYSPKEATSSQS